MSGQCLSSDVSGHALTPDTRRCLGRPLPHQLADRTWTAPRPPELCPLGHATLRGHRALPALSQRDRSPAAILESRVRYPCIPHPFATNIGVSYPTPMSVRLACLSHAASVRSEPGSNSSLFCCVSPPPDRSPPATRITTRGSHSLAHCEMRVANCPKAACLHQTFMTRDATS